MDFHALLNRFWLLNQDFNFTSTEGALYFRLVYLGDCHCWRRPIQQSNHALYQSLQIAEKTLITARARLHKAGLLQFTPGRKRNPTTYQLAPPNELFVAGKGAKSCALPPPEELMPASGH